MSNSPFCWILDSQSARLKCDSFKGSIKILQNSVSLDLINNRKLEQPIQIVNISLDTPLGKCTDQYVRANDLILRFESNEDLPLHTEIYFRVIHATKNLIAIESIVSLHTDQLDFRASVEISAELFDIQSKHAKSNSFAGTNFSISESIECEDSTLCLTAFDTDCQLPIDAPSVDSIDHPSIRLHLQPGRLEKGVIRRMRALSVFCATNSNQLLMDLISQFENSSIPLTT